MSKQSFLEGLCPVHWLEFFGDVFQSDPVCELNQFLLQEYQRTEVFPEQSNIFQAFQLLDPADLKVVLLGQDPYHNQGQAHGLAFSVLPGQKTPPSLKNMYKELQADIGLSIPKHGFLQAWAKQGILLLNSVLTVRAHEPASHQKKGWEYLTDHLIQNLSREYPHLVFVFWGNFAKKKAKWVDAQKHSLICGVHPSPLSANRGFFGSRPFSKINQALIEHQQEEIDWCLPDLDSSLLKGLYGL